MVSLTTLFRQCETNSAGGMSIKFRPDGQRPSAQTWLRSAQKVDGGASIVSLQ